MNLWNNIFRTNLEQNHEAYKFVMLVNNKAIVSMKENNGQ
jgi:hypothetical protein